MKTSKDRWRVSYQVRQETETKLFSNLGEAFSFVEELENGPGGFAYEIGIFDEFPKYMRHIDEENGRAFWVNLETGDKFE